jgi:hypothetical protein
MKREEMKRQAMALGLEVPAPPLPPPSRTKWTRLVPPPVLTGHVVWRFPRPTPLARLSLPATLCACRTLCLRPASSAALCSLCVNTCAAGGQVEDDDAGGGASDASFARIIRLPLAAHRARAGIPAQQDGV